MQIKAKQWSGHNRQILIDVQDYILRKINIRGNDNFSYRLCNKSIVWYVNLEAAQIVNSRHYEKAASLRDRRQAPWPPESVLERS